MVSGNSPIAYERGVDAVGPDVWVVNGGEDRGQSGWVPWREGGLMPTLIIEMLSPSTEHRDRGEKKRIYQDVFKAPDYFLVETDIGGVEAYRLKHGVYERYHSDRQGRYRCTSVPLFLKMVDGRLRWMEKNGDLLPNDIERAARLQEARLGQEEARMREQELRIRADNAETELRALQAELKRLRGE